MPIKKPSKKTKFEYYNIRDLMNEFPQCYYYMVIGERSNGKTYSSMDYCLEKYFTTGEQFAYLRRWGEDVKPGKLSELWAGHVQNKRVTELSNGVFDTISYYNRKFYAATTDPETLEVKKCPIPMGFVFDIAGMEHYKSVSFPGITTIVFDEFLSRNGYLPSEFILFTNTLSTIIRDRDNVKIIMLGNTVNKYCPYFTEMGLRHVDKMKPGDKDVYQYGQTDLSVAVEMTRSAQERGGKKSDVYFAFDNPRLQMITGGAWEIGIYPHLVERYRPKDVFYNAFLKFEKDLLHLEFVSTDKGPFIFVHPKTTDIKDPDNDLVFTDTPDQRYNWKMALTKQTDDASKFVRKMLQENRIFYSDNETGETFRNYIMWSDQQSIKNT